LCGGKQQKTWGISKGILFFGESQPKHFCCSPTVSNKVFPQNIVLPLPKVPNPFYKRRLVKGTLLGVSGSTEY